MRYCTSGVCFLVVLAVCAPRADATSGLYFVIDGDTWTMPFAITNNSTGGENVIRFQLDLSTVTTGRAILFDTVGGVTPPNTSGGQDFTAIGGSDALTGLVPLANTPKVADGATLLDISFTDFDPGESFSWLIDVDPADGIPPSTITGAQMIGTTALVDFSDGQRLTGVLAALAGNSDASQFTVTGTGPIPDDGVIPEPITLALVGMSVAGLGRYVRRRQAA